MKKLGDLDYFQPNIRINIDHQSKNFLKKYTNISQVTTTKFLVESLWKIELFNLKFPFIDAKFSSKFRILLFKSFSLNELILSNS